MFSRCRMLPLVAVVSLMMQGIAAQSSKPQVSIPDFPGATSTPSTTELPPLPRQGGTQQTTTDKLPPVPPQQQSVPADVSPVPAQQTAPAPASAPAASTQPSEEKIEPTTPAQMEGSPALEKPAKPLTKSEEKALRKKQKEDEKKAKEAEEEKKFLKLQGDDIVAPTLDADGNPIHLAPCSKKDKVCQKKRKALLKKKTAGMKIENGTLTVDGWTGKARLNYDISEVKFLYVWVPGMGTTIISTQNFPGAKEQKDALKGNTLSVKTADDHLIQLNSDNPLMGKSKKSLSMWVATDADYNLTAKYPTFGYGSTAKAPYNWPGTRPLSEKEQKQLQASHAPPLPKGMETKQMELPCVNVKPGEEIKPVKLNGITYTPKPCAVKGAAPGAYSTAEGERPPDGSGAASTGVADPAISGKK